MNKRTTRHRKAFAAALSVLLAVCVAVCAVITGANAYVTGAAYDSVRASYIASTGTYGYLANPELSMPYQTVLRHNLADEDILANINSWRVTNYGTNDSETQSNQRVARYVTYLADIAIEAYYPQTDDGTSDYEINGKAITVLRKISENAGIAPAEYGGRLLSSLSSEEKSSLNNYLMTSGELENALMQVGGLDGLGEFDATIKDLVLTLCRMDTLLTLTYTYRNTLYDISQNVSDGDMQRACQELAAALGDATCLETGEQLALNFPYTSIRELKQTYLNSVWNTVVFRVNNDYGVSLSGMYGNFLSHAYAAGSYEYFDELYAFSLVESALKTAITTHGEYLTDTSPAGMSKQFNACFDMIASMYKVSTDIHIMFTYQGRADGFFVSVVDGSETEFSDYQSRLQNLRAMLDMMTRYFNQAPYGLVTNDTSNYLTMSALGVSMGATVDQQMLDNNLNEIEDMIQSSGDVSLQTGFALHTNRLIYGDLYITEDAEMDPSGLMFAGETVHTNGTLDLAGGILNVRGSYTQTGGTVLVDSGTLIVGGDYAISSSGMLNMTSAEDSVSVMGDFSTSSDRVHTGCLTNGTMYLNGSFTQNHGYYDSNFNCTESHTVVFSGGVPQNISFYSTSSGFANVRFENSDISFSTEHEMRGFSLLENTVFRNDFNMKFSTPLDLNGHSLTVGGNLDQIKGEITINGGSLTVGGDYTVEYNGTLNMTHGSDAVTVGGDFTMLSASRHTALLTDGVMYLKGNVTQSLSYYSDNFNCTGNHKVVLNGNGAQLVNFSHANSGFNQLEIINHNVSFAGNTRFATLTADATINNDAVLNLNGTEDLDGHTLTVNGSLTLSGDGQLHLNGGAVSVTGSLTHSGSTLYVESGSVTVGGDYAITGNGLLSMVDENDVVTVNGDFSTSSDISHTGYLTNGTMHLRGDFTQNQGYYNSNFNSTDNHTVVFDGSETQNISFYSTSSGFANVRFENSDISFSTEHEMRGFSLLEDTVFRNDFNMKFSTPLDLNGHSLTVGGNLDQIKGEITINGGSLTVGGDYTVKYNGTLNMTNPADAVTVNGDFTMLSASRHTALLTDGVMYLKGNVTQSFSYYGDNFNCTGNHKVVLNGSGAQLVNFQDTDSGFNQLEIINHNVSFAGNTRFATLTADAVINNDTTLNLNGTEDLDGHTLTVNGSLTLSGDGQLHLNGGAVSVAGSLTHSGSTLYVESGSVTVGGDYAITENGLLSMVDENDVVTVNGDFSTSSGISHSGYLTNGTMHLRGDFTQNQGYYNSNFNSTDNHTVVFDGSETQNISFYSTDSGFANVRFTNSDILFNPDKQIRGFSLLEDTTLANDFNMNVSGSLDLNGHSLTVGGNLDQIRGEMLINGGSLTVNGDYTVEYNGTLNMTNPADAVTVGGDFTMLSASRHTALLTEGVMHLRGDVTQNNTYNPTNFKCTGNHMVILDGSEPQVIYLQSSDSKFNSLELWQDMSRYTFNRPACWNNLFLLTEVYEVEIIPMQHCVAYGIPLYFYAYLNGINLSETPAQWSIVSEVAEGTTLSDDGVLTLSPNETAETITVRVTSTDDPEKYDEAVITISHALSGDVNLDGVVNIEDVTALQKYLARIDELGDEQFAVADTDGDGRITIIDATQIQKYISGLDTILPIGQAI